MAQPTQQFPPWLSPSAFIVTDAAGDPIATETTIEYIAPTYFGPSIPLGTLYSFGGTSEPATVILPVPTPQTTTTIAPPSTTATPSITTSITTNATPTTSVPSTAITTSTVTSATPTSSVTISSSTSVSSSASSNTILSSTLTSASSTSSSSVIPSSTPTGGAAGPAAMAGLTKGQLVGVIVASILGLIFLFVLALFLYLWCRGRRNRRNYNTFSQGIDDDYYFVPEGAGRVPGEGSPRHSGEEQDTFLQQSTAGGGSSTAGPSTMGLGGDAVPAIAAGGIGAAAMTQVPSSQSATRPPVSRVPVPAATAGSHSSASTGSNASGFGVLLDRPSLGVQLPSMEEREESGAGSSRPLSDIDMRRIARESVLPDEYDQYVDEEYTGAYAYSGDSVPPRLVGTAGVTTPLLSGDEHMPLTSAPSLARDLGHQPSLEENATLLTARRVKVEDLGPRMSPNPSPASAGPSSAGLLGALGLGGLANLGRLSWFNKSTSRHSISEPDFTIEPFLEKDLETGRQLLSPTDATRHVDSFGNRARGVGPDGIRPASGLSARSGASGATLYLDAESSIPGTPSIAHLPRAVTPAGAGSAQAQHSVPEHAWLASPLGTSGQLSGMSSPPGYEQPLGASGATSPMQSPTGTSFDHTLPTDILDMPAPAALNHFASISSLKETATGSSAGGYKPAPFPPPGLETVRPIGWADSVGANASPVGPFGIDVNMEAAHGAGISIDILEEAPPDAEHGWRTMSAPAFADGPNNRGTFGTFVQGFGTIMSEQGSLHSMRSHFTPSSRSTGSAPASRREVNSSVGSANSARPSAHSSSQHSAYSAIAHSLVRAGSLTNDDRRRGSSPALSAFGHQARHGPAVEASLSPTIGRPPSAHMSPADKTASGATLRSVQSDTTAVMDTSASTVHGMQPARSLSPLSANFPLNAPWAGGLDSDWQPSA
ncbi:hypothetical protein HYPSUDRAFT_438748 [Hypholoma sublateritium FD-334 SS-4]|uniref:Uncharacterized protein n=1 Tax=Hypholoma sublateritium (strain FD-334 SS-4) TaxID=945553 RepID=A0A0D2LCT2_HYPSF|nr:hypothetical protein HYPSUDRAFT_438748 [Hypholoma sublateritium FD-334 SS-4]